MKVLFYNYGNGETFSIGYLSSYLKANGHKTELIAEPNLDIFLKTKLLNRINFKKRLLKEARRFSPDIMAFTSTTNQFPKVKEMMSFFKKELDIPIIIGGNHPTILPEYVLKNSSADMLCRGEGELAFLELINNIEKTNIKNIWFKQNDKIIKNDVRPLIQNLNLLPFPDREIFRKYGLSKRDYNIMTSRGCPYSCTYCCNHYYQKLYRGCNYVRRRSEENVIEELKINKDKYKIKSVYFFDDTFLMNHKWINGFLKSYKKEIDLPFHCLTRPETVNRKIIKLMKLAGCTHIDIGIESGSERIRNSLKRFYTNKQLIDSAKIIKSAGIKLNVFNIFGFPDETIDDMYETLKINEEIEPDGTFSFHLSPFPKTEITKDIIKRKMIDKEGEKRINNGELSYFQGEEDTLLNHPLKEDIRNFKIYTPLINKNIFYLKSYFKKRLKNGKSPNKLIHLLSLMCVDPSRTLIKAKEVINLIYKGIFI